MAYMGQDRKKELVAGLKKALKGRNIKYSVSVRHHSTIVLTIRKGAYDFFDAIVGESESIEHCKKNGHLQVNVYHIDSHFKPGKARDILNVAYDALMEGNHNNSDLMTDYHDVGWYVDINIGEWNKPYELLTKKARKVVKVEEPKPEAKSAIDEVLAEPFFADVEKEPAVVVAPEAANVVALVKSEPAPKSVVLRRLRFEKVGELESAVTHIYAAPDCAKLVSAFYVGADREHVLRVDLDAKNRVLGIEEVGMGGIHCCALTAKDVLKGAIVANASAFVLVHNHPSGDPTPSMSDVLMTKAVAEAAEILGLQLLDHVVVTEDPNAHCSIRDIAPWESKKSKAA